MQGTAAAVPVGAERKVMFVSSGSKPESAGNNATTRLMSESRTGKVEDADPVAHFHATVKRLVRATVSPRRPGPGR